VRGGATADSRGEGEVVPVVGPAKFKKSVSHSIFEGVGSGGIGGAEEEELTGQVIWRENLQATM